MDANTNRSSKLLSLCVFCGSSMGKRLSYAEAAEKLGRTLAEQGMVLVYGGGDVGLMGIVAEAVMKNGGKAIGIIPRRLYELVDQQEVSELLVVQDMHERKALMEKKADAFLCMPGGIGTMEELFEVWSWRYIGYHQKPVALLNIEHYYDHLLEMLKHMIEEGFLHKEIYEDLIVSDDIGYLLDALRNKATTSSAAPFLKKPERRNHN
ncbi:MAG: TIGR00730 family Rossman fold protein [Treponema sp.]|nr:TIGR00730 family Rossman fold protein [Spirochaetota bacterium]NLH89325.1 TIGR00730 family Rossman fold protein [Treponema sp.]HOH16637.1 TIGR00730 family Rossman fold protein [Rectinema sp.]HPN92521.1 TIGR00730 family Rossman fold protein [Rectinema sp.]